MTQASLKTFLSPLKVWSSGIDRACELSSYREGVISLRKRLVLIHVKKQLLLLLAVLEGLFLTVWEQTEWFSLLQRQQFSVRRTPWLTSHACLHIL